MVGAMDNEGMRGGVKSGGDGQIIHLNFSRIKGPNLYKSLRLE